MDAGAGRSGEPTLLRVLLRQRHWQKHSTFAKEWDKAAKGIDPALVGSWPRHAQFYRWLRGELRELPYPDACRVLASIFPEHSVHELFEPCTPDTVDKLLQTNNSPAPATPPDLNHLQHASISNLWPRTNPDVLDDLIGRVSNATEEVSVFGLSRNFYAKDDMLPLFESKASEVPVTFYVMDPRCNSRRDRYRLEPVEAAMEDPTRYIREILRPLYAASHRIEPASPSAGLRIFTFNFPCSFAIEKIDRSCRVMLYGHGKRGTEGPILVFDEGTPYWKYFTDQIRWLERLAQDPREPWTSKDLVVRPLKEADLAI
ncbi:MAG: hypothetical protein GEV09_20960 [Pseudonocardiaceae bacterium]|nr:hypothetical protein [Pseudonocardiaceae bacterium]